MKRLIIIYLSVLINAALPAQNITMADSVVACAQAGNGSCQNLLGKWIFEGSHGFRQDYEKAVAWWMQSAKQNNDEATANLGFCYMYGMGVEADSATAARLFEKAFKQGNQKLVSIHDSLARSGSVFSAMLLARCYKMAFGVRRDHLNALKYYKMAAGYGQVEAMREAAILMRSNKDDAAAVAMFKEAMQNGDIVATYYYGKMLCEGRGVSQNHQKGVEYIRKAAEKDHAVAQYELAEAYTNGIGVNPSADEALLWYRKAALGGIRAAWWQLAECYREGRGTMVDFEEALECYAKASEVGYHNKLKAMLSGDDPVWNGTPFMHYLRGLRLLEVDGDPNAAIIEFGKLPKRLTTKNVMESLCMLHSSFAKQNVKKAAKQLQKHAATDRRAAYELALLTLKQDAAASEKTLASLANEGYTRAINYLADAYYDGGVLPKNRTKAILFYLQLEQQQRLSVFGVSRLAQAFRDGENGVKKNQERAAKVEKSRPHDTKNLLGKVVL